MQGAESLKNTKNADNCYVNYESRTRKVIHISQVNFQQKISLVDFTKFSKIQTQDVCKRITLVSDVDVPAFITHLHFK